MSESGNVVSFERSAAFLHRRAIKNRSSSPLDALELLRRALDVSPDNSEYLMDAAEVYYEMGQYGQSIRLLARVMRLPDAPPECYYGLGLNFWGMGSVRAAQAAMAGYLKFAEDGEYRDEVIDFLAQMHLANDVLRQRDRRKRAAARLLQRAGSLARAGESVRADWLLRQSLRHNPRQPIARALRALMLAKQGDRRAALREAERALTDGAPIEAMCMAAQALLDAGCRRRALRAFERAAGRRSARDAQPMLIRLMCALGLHDRAHAALRRMLKEVPYDREVLGRMAASIINLGQSAQKAAPYWRRILRVDPDDQLAAGYLQLAEAGALPPLIGYDYVAPAPRIEEIRREIAGWSAAPDEALATELFPTGAAPLRWAIVEERDALARDAVALLSRCGGPDAEALARDCLLEPDLPGSTRHQVIEALKDMGARPPYVEYAGEEFRMYHPALVDRRPIPESAFRVLWQALEVSREMLGGDLGALFQAWTKLLAEVRPTWGALRNPRAWSAAIAREALIATGHAVDDKEMATRFSCSRRGMLRCAKAIERAAAQPLEV